jgi:hypothetical protein
LPPRDSNPVTGTAEHKWLVAPQGFTNVANIRLIRFFHSDTLINTLR